MKKIFLVPAMIAVFGATTVYAADHSKKAEKTVTVSYTVENQFNVDFSDATNVVWTTTPRVQKATFTLNDVKMTAFYNLQGDYMGVTQDVDYAALAPKAKAAIAAKYKDYTVNEVIKLDNPEETNYFVDLKSDADEILVKVSPSSTVSFFKEVK